MNSTIDINKAIWIYLGDEHGGYLPDGRGEDRLRRAFPTNFEKVHASIEKYLNEPQPFEYPPNASSLAEAGDIFAAALSAKYPELDSISIQGLANRFTYSWK